MAGIYLHIPFCKKACYYCDFHFSTSLRYVDEMITAICTELVLKKNRASAPIRSIYFGGGTPSILTLSQFQQIFDTIYSHYDVTADAEITIEANPDDLSIVKVRELRQLPVNRFSIGIQSFFDEDLRWMNRAHTSSEAESSVKRTQDAGFDNLTIDLIYGFPLLSDQKWAENISKALALNVPHISAYSLTVEEKTALASFIKKGRQIPMDEAQSASQFIELIGRLSQEGFEQYEISNFAKSGRYAIHNTNYWKGEPYVGIGPSAHGYNGAIRSFNVANNALYLQKLLEGNLAESEETLSIEDHFNEYIMTSLRTMWGVDMNKVRNQFPKDFLTALVKDAEPYFQNGWLQQCGEFLTLSYTGKLYADKISSALFIVNKDEE